MIDIIKRSTPPQDPNDLWLHTENGKLVLSVMGAKGWTTIAIAGTTANFTEEEKESLINNISIQEQVSSAEDLPTSAKVGQAYIVGENPDTLDLYFCVGENEDGTPIWKSDPEIEDLTKLIDEKLEPIQEEIDNIGEVIDEKLIPIEEKLDTIEEGAQVNVQADWDETDESLDSFIKNKPFGETENGFKTLSKENIAANILYLDDTMTTDASSIIFPEENTVYDSVHTNEYTGADDYVVMSLYKKPVLSNFTSLQYDYSNDATGTGPSCACSEECFSDEKTYLYENKSFTAPQANAPIQVDANIANLKYGNLYYIEIDGIVYKPITEYYGAITVEDEEGKIYNFSWGTGYPNSGDYYLWSNEFQIEQKSYIISIYSLQNVGGKFFMASGKKYPGEVCLINTNTFNYIENTGTFELTRLFSLDTSYISEIYANKYHKDSDTLIVTGLGQYAAKITHPLNEDEREIEYIQLAESNYAFYYLDVLSDTDFVFGARGLIGIYEMGDVKSQYVWKCSFVKYLNGIPYASVQSYGDGISPNYQFGLAKWDSSTEKFVQVLNNGTGASFHAFGYIEVYNIYYAFTYNDTKCFCSADGENWYLAGRTSGRVMSAVNMSLKAKKPLVVSSHSASNRYIHTIEFIKGEEDTYTIKDTTTSLSAAEFTYIGTVFDDKIIYFENYPYSNNPRMGYYNLDYVINNSTYPSEGKSLVMYKYTRNTLKIFGKYPNYAIIEREVFNGQCIYKKPKNYNCTQNELKGTILIDTKNNIIYVQTADNDYYYGDRGLFINTGFSILKMPTKVSDLTNDKYYVVGNGIFNIEEITDESIDDIII